MADAQAWPIEEIASCSSEADATRFETVFNSFRKALLASESDEVEAQVAHAEMVWVFLAVFCSKCPVKMKQVLECISVLNESQAWRDAFNSRRELKDQVQTLPDDIRSSFGADPDVILKSTLSTTSIEKLKPKDEPVLEERQGQAQDGVVGYKEAERLRSNMMDEVDSSPNQASQDDDLGQAIKAVLAINTATKWENDAVKAFAHLRRSCLHVAGDDGALRREEPHAAGVLNFIIDFTIRYKLRVRQACEVLNLLMACSEWAATFKDSSALQERVRTELGEDAQASFGLQSPTVMDAISFNARQKAALAEAAEWVDTAPVFDNFGLTGDDISPRSSEGGEPPADDMVQASTLDREDPFKSASEDEEADPPPAPPPPSDDTCFELNSAGKSSLEHPAPVPSDISSLDLWQAAPAEPPSTPPSVDDGDLPPPAPPLPLDEDDFSPPLTAQPTLDAQTEAPALPSDTHGPSAAATHPTLDADTDAPSSKSEDTSITTASPSEDDVPPPPPTIPILDASTVSGELVDARRLALSMRKMRQGLSRQLRFQHTIEEIYFDACIDANVEGAWCEPPNKKLEAMKIDTWEEVISPEGKKYYWNTKSRETRWKLPAAVVALTSSVRARAGDYGLKLGTHVEVFSNSRQVWCDGIVDKLSDQGASVSFRLPMAGSFELARKDVPYGSKDLRVSITNSAPSKSNSRASMDMPKRSVSHQSFKQEHPPNSVSSSTVQARNPRASPDQKTSSVVEQLPSVARSGSRPSDQMGGPPPNKNTSIAAEPSPAVASSRRGPSSQMIGAQVSSHHHFNVSGTGHASGGYASFSSATVLGGSRNISSAPNRTVGSPTKGSPTQGGQDAATKGSITGSPTTGGQDAAVQPQVLVPNFEPEERAGYDMLFQKVCSQSRSGPEVIPRFLATAGLPRRAMREIWNVANPTLKPTLGSEEFARCCRLVSHCQAMQRSAPHQKLVLEGERPLRVYLREKCLGLRPRYPPHFS